VSYQIFVQRFENGDAAVMPTDAFESVFRPYVDREQLEFGRRHLRLPDGGEAELYCGDPAELDSVMVS
jgi:hypothetical protein